MPDLQKHVVQSQLFPLPQNRSPCRNGLCKGVSYDEITQQYKGLLNVIFLKFLFIYYISLFIYQSLPIYQNELFYCLNIGLVYKKSRYFLQVYSLPKQNFKIIPKLYKT